MYPAIRGADEDLFNFLVCTLGPLNRRGVCSGRRKPEKVAFFKEQRPLKATTLCGKFDKVDQIDIHT